MKNLILKKIALASALTLGATSSFGYFANETVLEGTIRSFNNKEVEVFSHNKIYKVPRTWILLSDLKADQVINIEMTLDQFASLKNRPVTK